MQSAASDYNAGNSQERSNICWQATSVTSEQRASQKGQTPKIVWFTGLSGSGKSTLANALDERLFAMKRHAFVLDGDNVRHGLCNDLGFSEADREENIRRIGEVARLMTDAGLYAISAFISPFRRDRDRVRAMVPEGRFIEVFVDAPLEVCESRDPKGLYEKARRGEIRSFTGIDSPYEAPLNPELTVHTNRQSIDECLALILEQLNKD